jgi:ligand-binding SRPBCC domain-containing protein
MKGKNGAARITRHQHLNISITEAWDFFSTPVNLAEITPPWLDFRIVSEVPDKMHAGLILQYNVHPFLNVPISWVTEITHCNAPYFFVDEQRSGPYRLWHHQHHFKETADGVLMTDIVHYILPFEPFSSMLAGGLVRRKLSEIFSYRHAALDSKFN